MQDLPSARSHRGGAGREKIPFRENQPLQVIDFVETKFAILIVFEFFLMTAEVTEALSDSYFGFLTAETQRT